MHQRTGQRQALFKAQRQFVGGVGGDTLQAECLAHPLDFLLLRPTAQAVDAGEKAQILFNRQVAIQGEFLRHIAQMLARFTGADLQVHVQHQRFTRSGDQQAAHHFKGSGFARAVGS